MSITRKHKAIINMLIIALLMALAIAAESFSSQAISGLEANGYINSSGGAVLRTGASKSYGRLGVLEDGSPVQVLREQFTHKKKRSATYKWYLVKSDLGQGYVRSDLVVISKYGHATGTTTKKVAYRRGAGTKMSKKGNIKKKKTFDIVLEARAKGSSAVWYKIYRNGGYYYVKKSGTKIGNITSGLPTASSNIEPANSVVQSEAALRVVDGACSWGVQIAADNRFHYGKKPNSQHNGCYFCGTQVLTGGRSKAGVVNYEFSYCCNPFVHACFAHGGNEQTMLKTCKNGSSYDYHLGRGYDTSPLFAKLGHPNMSLLKKGDVICWDNHVVLYLGGGKIVESTGGDDNIPYSSKWNNSIRVTTLAASKYATAHGVYRYIGKED